MTEETRVMLSDKTTRSLAGAFQRVANATLVTKAGDLCDIGSAKPSDAAVPEAGSTILLITISSFVFRLSIFFQVSDSPSTRDYYCSGSGAKTLEENFSEVANLCCGAFSRELVAQFHHLAMSIPYRLDWQSLAFVQELKPQFQSVYDIVINKAARVRITLCMTSSRPVDFTFTEAAVSHAGGELELF